MNLTADSTWTLGILLGLPILASVILCLIGLGIWGFFLDMIEMTVSCAIFLVLLIGGAAFGYFPYETQYHRWEPVIGTVTAVDSRLLTTGSGDSAEINTRFVVNLSNQTAGDPSATGGQYACDDTRCAQVRPGDVIGLACKRHWQFSGTDGYDCNYVGRKAA